MKGKRTAPPRQQTLRGAMDWSYGTLSPAEQRALRFLAVFPGHFDADGAAKLAQGDGGSAEGLSHVADLVEKSLVSARFRGDQLSYQLLATTRAYALEKLRESDEEREARRRHAEHTLQVLDRVQQNDPSFDPVRWCAEHGGIIDDIRAVVSWAFSAGGDSSLGVAVAAASARSASLLSAHEEFSGYFAKALKVPGLAERDPASAVKLALALGAFTHYARGNIDASIETTSKMAAVHASAEDLELVLEGHWSHKTFDLCRYAEGLEIARQHWEHNVSADAGRRFNSERVMGFSLHLLGDQVGATELLERVVAHAPPLVRGQMPVTIDTRVSASIALARSLWLQGHASRAERVAGEALARARGSQKPIAICYVLAFALCPLAAWNRNRAEAGRLTQLLGDEADGAALGYWSGWARFHAFALSREPLEAVGELNPMQREMLGTLRPELTSSEVLAQCLADDRRWCAPEVLRAAAQPLLDHDPERAEPWLLRALQAASRQNALAWELRTAISLGRLWQNTKRKREAVEVLASVLARLPEPNPDADRARALLSVLKGADR
jgi:predicted ATPase